MDVFIARQPIFKRDRDVFGYELLFRDGLANFFGHHDVNEAAARVIADSTFLFGIDKIAGGKKAFVNVTRDMLVRRHAGLLPRHDVVLEILEHVEPDDAVIAACARLKDKGFTLALDDFVYREALSPLVDLATIIKIDWRAMSRDACRRLVEQLLPRKKLLLAEKLETEADFREALDMGFHYFQGYFFCRPTILSRRNLVGNRLIYLQLLKEIHKPEIDFATLEKLISQDLALSYKLLRYINSAFFALRNQIQSIRHALVLIGAVEVKKWATLLSLSTMAEDKPFELMQTAALRARLCELISVKLGLEQRRSEFFLMGLFTVIDALLDRPLMEVLLEIPLVKDIKKALLHRGKGNHRNVLEVVTAYEAGDWPAVESWSEKAGLDPAPLPSLYLEALQWVQDAGVGASAN
ncbi:EAL and HDOD domain-containing protein [Acanthopleuribacter pedis]|uniref:HDOD domain-containing protein n=1 Tax=Acanthopleuribacter pedis TaxID=442870 RepID=A0A8J7U4R3_9BACT|nr:HDOD domain-containing protein [Acanthopleuribacter pedis]MBO1321738.1 HDOD domain-containing protein [Acanthopleuribacter pedis]